MPGEINCLFTSGLIPFVEKECGTTSSRRRREPGRLSRGEV
jgi:hypothetical protein